MKNKMVGFVTTYEDKDGNLVLCNPDPDIDWKEMERIGDDRAIIELLEYQLCNGYDIIYPEEIGALTSALIIGEGIEFDDEENLIRADKIWWLENYALILVWEELKAGRKVVFQKAEMED